MDTLDKKIVRKAEDGSYIIFCEACKCGHRFDSRWTFNGNYEKPTFSPSMLIRSGHYIPEHNSDVCWCTYNIEHPDDPYPYECTVCHSFVVDGVWQYLSDCTHNKANMHVPLIEF